MDLISQEVLVRSVVKVLVDDSSKQVSDMNAAAQEICLKTPSMLIKRGELQLAAQDAVIQSGYQFKIEETCRRSTIEEAKDG